MTKSPSGTSPWRHPNHWCDEHDNPRYILDLLKSIVTLSQETRRLINSLPELKL